MNVREPERLARHTVPATNLLTREKKMKGLAGFERWRHAGEDGSKAVYAWHSYQQLTIELLGLALCWAILYWRHALPTFWALCVLFLLTKFAHRRRALILDSAALVYRPTFGDLVRVPYNEITRLRCTIILVSFWLRPSAARGLLIELTNGQTERIPLNLPRANEILQNIVRSAGLVSTEPGIYITPQAYSRCQGSSTNTPPSRLP
jgi:hypothetical protein